MGQSFAKSLSQSEIQNHAQTIIDQARSARDGYASLTPGDFPGDWNNMQKILDEVQRLGAKVEYPQGMLAKDVYFITPPR